MFPRFHVFILMMLVVTSTQELCRAEDDTSDTQKSVAVIFVLDHSGSMSMPVPDRDATVQQVTNEAVVVTIAGLEPSVTFGVVMFDSEAEWVIKPAVHSDRRDADARILAIEPGGGTNIFDGLQEAYTSLVAMSVPALNKHVILLTDGQSAPPPNGSYVQLVKDMSEAGIALTTIGLGDACDESLLKQLAEITEGRFRRVHGEESASLAEVMIEEIAFQRDKDKAEDSNG